MERIIRNTKPLTWVLIAVGTIALFVGVGLDLGGFLGGMLQGAGFAVALLGAYFLGMHQGADESTTRGDEPGAWLPSRDGGR